MFVANDHRSNVLTSNKLKFNGINEILIQKKWFLQHSLLILFIIIVFFFKISLMDYNSKYQIRREREREGEGERINKSDEICNESKSYFIIMLLLS